MVPESRSPSAPSRRAFLRSAVAAAAALSLPRLARAAGNSGPISVIGAAASFPFLQPRELAKVASIVGWTGLEASVREGGQIQPVRVRDDLPNFFSSVQEYGLDVPAIATDLVSMRNAAAEGVFRTAAKLGIKHVTLGHWMYDADRPRETQVAVMVRDLRELGQMAAELGLRLGLENTYRPSRFGNSVNDLIEVIRRSGQDVGICFNPARAILVHGSAVEEAALARPFLVGAYAEDFLPRSLSPSHEPQPCVLGMGVSEPAFFHGLRGSGFNGFVCLRYGYRLGNDQQIVDHCRADFGTLQQWLGQFVASPFM